MYERKEQVENGDAAPTQQVQLPTLPCLLKAFPCPPCKDLPSWVTFWKVTSLVSGVLLVVLVITTWNLAREVNRQQLFEREVKELILSGDANITSTLKGLNDTVQNHRQMTLENRTVQAEIKGILQGWIAERKHQIEQGGARK